MTVDDLRAAAERDAHLARVCARQLDLLDPARAPHAKALRLGIELPLPDEFPDDELGAAQWYAEVEARRIAFLTERWNTLSEARERLHRARRDRELGLDRFVQDGGRYRLADLLEPERERQAREAARGIVSGRDLMLAGKEKPPGGSWVPR